MLFLYVFNVNVSVVFFKFLTAIRVKANFHKKISLSNPCKLSKKIGGPLFV